MSDHATDGPPPIATAAVMDPKCQKEQEKAKRAAMKELTAEYKSWCQQLKSKDSKLMLAMQPYLNDDTYLLAGGGIAALIKAVTAKDADVKSVALSLTSEQLVNKQSDELPEDVYLPSGLHVRRCITYIHLGVSAGIANGGTASLLTCLASPDAQQQYLAARILRGLAAAVLAIDETYTYQATEVVNAQALRDNFIDEFILKPEVISSIISILRLPSARPIGVTEEVPLKKGAKAGPAMPNNLTVLELVRLLHMILCTARSRKAVIRLPFSDVGDSDFFKQHADELWLPWMKNSSNVAINGVKTAVTALQTVSEPSVVPESVVAEIVDVLLATHDYALALDATQPIRYSLLSTIVAALGEVFVSPARKYLQDHHPTHLSNAMRVHMAYIQACPLFLESAALRYCQDIADQNAAVAAASATKDDKDDKASHRKGGSPKAVRGGAVEAPVSVEDVHPEPDLKAACKHELLPFATPLSPVRSSFMYSRAVDRTKQMYGDAMLRDVYDKARDACVSLYRGLLLQAKCEDKVNYDALGTSELLLLVESLSKVLNFPIHAAKELLTTDVATLLVVLSVFCDDCRVAAGGLGILKSFVKVLANNNVSQSTRDVVEWALHNMLSDATTLDGSGLLDVIPPVAIKLVPTIASPAEVPAAGLPSKVAMQMDPTSALCVPIGTQNGPWQQLEEYFQADGVAIPKLRSAIDARVLSSRAVTYGPELSQFIAKRTPVAAEPTTLATSASGTAKSKQAVAPAETTPASEVPRFEGPWLTSTEVLALLCKGYASALPDIASDSAAKVKKQDPKAAKPGVATESTVQPFDITVPPLKLNDYSFSDATPVWPDRIPAPALTLSMAPAPEAAVVAQAPKDAKKREGGGVAASGKSKKDADQPQSPRALLSSFPEILQENADSAQRITTDMTQTQQPDIAQAQQSSQTAIRLHGLRLASSLMQAEMEESLRSTICLAVARLLIDSIAELSLLVRGMDVAVHTTMRKAAASPRSPAATAGRRGSQPEALDATAFLPVSPVAIDALVRDVEPADLSLLVESVARGVHFLSFFIPQDAKIVDCLSAIGPLLTDSVFSLCLPEAITRSLYWWASAYVSPSIMALCPTLSGFLAAQHLSIIISDPRVSIKETDPTYDVRTLCTEFLRRCALADQFHRVYEWTTGVAGNDADALQNAGVSGSGAGKRQSLKAPAAQVGGKDTAKDTKKPAGGKGGKEEAPVLVALSSVVKSTLTAPPQQAVVGVEADCKSESIGVRLSSNLLRLVPAMLAALELDTLESAYPSLRVGLLQILSASGSVYRARDKLVAEQLRLSYELRAAELLAAKPKTDAGEDNSWSAIAANMRESRSASGIFVYGSVGVLVVGRTRAYTFQVEEPDASTTASSKKQAVPAGKPSKGEQPPDDPFAAKRGVIHATECWYGGPAESQALLVTPQTRIPTPHNLDKLCFSGGGYAFFSAQSHAVSVCTTQSGEGADGASAGKKPGTASGRRTPAAASNATATGATSSSTTSSGGAEGAEEEKLSVTLGDIPLVPPRLHMPSTATCKAFKAWWSNDLEGAAVPAAESGSAGSNLAVKAASIPLDKLTHVAAAAVVADARSSAGAGGDAQATLNSLQNVISEAFSAAAFGVAASALFAPLRSILSLHSPPATTNTDILLTTLQASWRFDFDKHRGAACQSASSEITTVFSINDGVLVALEALACPLPLALRSDTSKHVVELDEMLTANIRNVADFIRDRPAIRDALWGMQVAENTRRLSAEEQAAIDAAGANLLVDVLPEGLDVDVAAGVVREAMSMGKPDPVWRIGPIAAQRWAALLDRRCASRRLRSAGLSALHAAVASLAGLQVARAYVSAGASPNVVEADTKVPVLASALLSGQIDVAELLLEAGADANAVDGFGNPVLKYAFVVPAATDVQACSEAERDVACAEPLHQVVAADATTAAKAVCMLVQHGANPNVSDKQKNAALHWLSGGACIVHAGTHIRGAYLFSVSSIRNPHTQTICTALAHARAEFNAMNACGSTPLHVAIEVNNIDACWSLLEFGANPVVFNNDLMSSLHVSVISSAAPPALVESLLATGCGRQCMYATGSAQGSASFVDLVDNVFKRAKESALLRHKPAETVSSLLSYRDKQGRTPLEVTQDLFLSSNTQQTWSNTQFPALSSNGTPMWLYLMQRYTIPVRHLAVSLAGEDEKHPYIITVQHDGAAVAAIERREQEVHADMVGTLQHAASTNSVPVSATTFKPLAIEAKLDPSIAALDAAAIEWANRAKAGHVHVSRVR